MRPRLLNKPYSLRLFYSLTHAYAETTEYQLFRHHRPSGTYLIAKLLSTSASIQKVQAATVQNNANVNLSEVLQWGCRLRQINNRENYAKTYRFRCVALALVPLLACVAFGCMSMVFLLTMPDGQGQSSNIDLNSLDHIEVLTGPFSSLYGIHQGGTDLD